VRSLAVLTSPTVAMPDTTSTRHAVTFTHPDPLFELPLMVELGFSMLVGFTFAFIFFHQSGGSRSHESPFTTKYATPLELTQFLAVSPQ
jgi:hypothetical protein